MKSATRAALLCSLALQSFGARLSCDTFCHNAVDVMKVTSAIVTPTTCGTGLVPATVTLSGSILKPVSNATIQIFGYVGSVPFLSLNQPLCEALLHKPEEGPLKPSIEVLTSKLVQPVAGGALKDVSTGQPLGINAVAPDAGLLAPVTNLLNGLLGGGNTGGQAGNPLGALLGGGNTGGQGGSLLGVAGNLPLLGGLLNSLTGVATPKPAEKVPTSGGLINGAVVPLLDTVDGLVSGLPLLGPLLTGVLGTVSQLVVSVLNLVLTLLQGLPVTGGMLSSVEVRCPGDCECASTAFCPSFSGDVTFKINLMVPVPQVPVLVQVPKISFFIRLFTDADVQNEIVCSKVTLAM